MAIGVNQESPILLVRSHGMENACHSDYDFKIWQWIQPCAAMIQTAGTALPQSFVATKQSRCTSAHVGIACIAPR